MGRWGGMVGVPLLEEEEREHCVVLTFPPKVHVSFLY